MKEAQWTQMVSKLLDKEIKASKELEEMIFSSRNKNRKQIHSLHKPLITKKIK